MANQTQDLPKGFRSWEEFDAAFDEQQGEYFQAVDGPAERDAMRRQAEYFAFPGDR